MLFCLPQLINKEKLPMLEFTSLQKYKISLMLLLVTILGQASIALYLPSLPSIMQNLGVSANQVKQTVTIFILGFGLSTVIYGPLSDRYGRKIIMLIGIIIACFGYIAALFSATISSLMLARLIQGLGCGALLVGARSSTRDVFSGRELASSASYLSMGFAIGFGFSPSIGGFLSYNFGWRSNFIFLLIIALIIFFIILLLMPETMKDKERHLTFKFFLKKTFIDYKSILKHFRFLKLLLAGLFAYSVVVAYNIMTPFLIQHGFKISATNYGYLGLLIGLPYYCGSIFNKNLVLKLGIEPVFILGYILIIFAGLAMLILNIVAKPNLFYVIIPMMIATFGQAFIFSNTLSAALEEFPAKIGGKASAVFSSVQMIMVSVISAIMAFFSDETPLSLALIITALGIFLAIILTKTSSN
jgi:DHA1 family 2-module integral membrane pump EmrD-like MFS transporter